MAEQQPGWVDASDEWLVERVRGGDAAAFERLYERYFRRVHGFLGRRLANRADVEEAVQDVFLNLLSSLHSFRGEAPFGAWVFGVTRRTLANRFKKRRIESVPLDTQGPGAPSTARAAAAPGPDPLEVYATRQRLARLQQSFAGLSREQRRLFELHHLEHRTIREIARTTRRSEDAVKSHLYRARKQLLAP